MIPTTPVSRFGHWERFTVLPFYGSASTAAAAESAASAASAAAGAHPPPPPPPPHAPHPHAHPAEFHAWRGYERGFRRFHRGPSRLVWFGIGSIVTLIYVRHHNDMTSNGTGWACHQHAWKSTSDPDFRQSSSASPPPPPSPIDASFTTATPIPAASTENVPLDAQGRRFVPWGFRSREERREMWHAARAEKAEMKKEQEQLAQWKAEAEKIREQKSGEEDQARSLAEARVDLMLKSLQDLKAQLESEKASQQPAFTARV